MSNVALQIQLNPVLDTNALKQLFATLSQALSENKGDFNPVDSKKIQQELSNATKTIETFEKQFDGAKAQIENVNKELAKSPEIAQTFNKAFQFNQINQAIGQLASTLSNLSAPFAELDTQVKNIGTLGTKNFEEFAELSLDLSRKIPDSAATIAGAAYNAISAGIQGTNEEIISFVETAGKVAVAGVSDTNSAVNGLTSVLNAYKLTAADANTVSDTFFAAIKLGKTSFNEINAGLANVVPAASAAGVSFQEVSGFIAQMTALGVPTAQATTQIRAALIEVQKPGAELAKVMGNVTVEIDGTAQALTSSNIGQVLKQQGLAATLQQIEQASGKMGKSLTQVFSSSEAASAALLVTGDNAERMNTVLSQVATEVENNAASGAYDVAAQGIEARTQVFLNNITAGFSVFFSSLGEGANVAIAATSQLAPVVSSLSGLKTLIPDGAIGNLKNFAVTLLNSVVPGLITTDSTTKALAINTNALSAANLASAVKTKIYAAAQWLLNAALAANPVGLIVAGLIALGAVLVIAYKQSETFRNAVDAVFKFITEQAEKFLGYLKAFGAGISALFKLQNPLKAMSESVETTELEQKLEKSLKTIEEGTKKDLKFKADIEKADSFDKKVKDLEETEAKIKVITESDNRTPEQEKELERLTAKSQNLANAIGSVAKNAVTETKGAIDANGKYTEQLTVNVEKAKEFAKAQKEGLSKDLVKNQTEVSNALIQQNKVYEEQKVKLDQMAKKAVELKNAGKNDEYAKQVKEMEKFGKEVDSNKSKLISNFQTAVQGGTANDKAQKEVGKTLGLNNDQIKAMAENQKNVTSQVQQTSEAAKSLGDAFNEANKQQTAQLNKTKDELNGLRDKLKNSKDLTKEQKQQLELQEKQLLKEGKQLVANLRNQKATKDLTDKQLSVETKVAEKKKETALELFNREKDALNAEFEKLQLQRDLQLAIEGRSKNIFDELQIEKEKKKLYDDQLSVLQNQFKVGADGEVGLKLDKEKLDKAKDEYQKAFRDLNNNISKSEIAFIQINSKINNENLEDTKKQLAKSVKDTEYEISIGLANSFDLLSAVSNQLNLVEELIRRKADELKDVELLPDTDTSKVARLSALNKEIENLQLESVEFGKKINALNKQNLIASLNDDLKALNERGEIRKSELDQQKEFYDKLINTSRDNSLEVFADAKEKELNRLEDIFKRQDELEKERSSSAKKQFDALTASFNKGRLSEQAYYRQSAELSAAQAQNEQAELKRKQQFEDEKQRITNQAKLKELIAKSIANGQLLELERGRQIDELNLQRQRLEIEQRIRKESGDVEGFNQIQKQLDDLGSTISEKGDVITEYTKLMQGNITENLTNLFNGDPDKAKEGFKEIFGVIAGALKAQASATVTNLVLGQLNITAGATGLVGLLAVPAITALVNAAIGKLLDPVLSGLLSFSTGGRVDSPTMAIIGDASKSRAGADTEWVFRDDQINALLYRVANEFNKSLFSLVGNLRDDNTYLASLLQENLELSKYAITPEGNVIDTQSDIIALTLASVLNTSMKELDTKLGTIANYQTKLNEQSQGLTIDYNVFREEFSILKSELLNKESNSQVSNDLLKVVNVINNDNVIATIDEMKSEVVNRIDITNQKLDILTQTVAGLELSISQNDIYKANRRVEINRNLRSRT